MRLTLLSTFYLLLLLPSTASAQLGGLGGEDTAFSVSISPQYPAPLSKVSLSFLSSTLDLTNATLSISVDGKNIYKGSVQPVAVTIGKTGSVTSVTATMSLRGTSFSKTVSIQPQDVAIIAEPISSTVPLYPGKSHTPLEGDVRIVAVANMRNASGVGINPSTLSYAWTVEGASIASASGIGKTSIIVASPLQYRARDVSVAVTSPDGSLVGGDSLSLSAREPTIRVYENDPLLGIRFDRALSGTYTITNTESSLYAAPFSLPTTSGAPLIEWFLNGSPAQTGASITLRPTGAGQGNATLSLTASAGTFTQAMANLALSFGAKPESNFFGL